MSSNTKRHPQADFAIQIEQSWAAQGKLVEGAYQAYLVLSNQTGVPDEQKRQMRNIWMLSAQHLFATMIGRLSPGTEPDITDLRRFEALAREMHDFQVEMGQIKPQLDRCTLVDGVIYCRCGKPSRHYDSMGERGAREVREGFPPPINIEGSDGGPMPGEEPSQKH